MMPDSPDSSVLTSPQITRSGRKTKAPAAFGNVVTSDCVYASDDEQEEGLPVNEDDESPEWGEKPDAPVDSDEEEADESGGEDSADDEEAGGKNKAAKSKKAKKESGKPKEPSATPSSKPKASDTKKQGRTVIPAGGPPKPVVTKPSVSKAKATATPKDTKLPVAAKKPTLLPKSKTPASRPKTSVEQTEEEKQEDPDEDKDTSELSDEEEPQATKQNKSGKALLPAAPIVPAQKSRIDLSGPDRSSVPIPATTKPKPKGIVLAKKGSIAPAAPVKAEDKVAKDSAKKAARPVLLKPQPKAKSEVEENSSNLGAEKKPVLAKKPVAKPVKVASANEQSDEKNDAPTDSAHRGKVKTANSKKEQNVKGESVMSIAAHPTSLDKPRGGEEIGEGISGDASLGDSVSIEEAKRDSGTEDENQDAPRPAKAKTHARSSKAVNKRKPVKSDSEEEETQEKDEHNADLKDEDSVMTAVEEANSESTKHSKSKLKPDVRRTSSGGKRKAASQEAEDSDTTKINGSQEAQQDDIAGDESAPDLAPESKKRKTSGSPKKTASRTTSTASSETYNTSLTSASQSQGKKPAPAEKVPAAARLAIVEAMTHKDYIKLVDWQRLATSFKSAGSGPAMTPEKLKRHWREVLSADLRDLVRGTSRASSSGGKAGTKESLTKVHRKAIWKAMYDQCDKLDWKTVSHEADGMGVAKLKRHFKEAMRRDVDKMIG